MLKVYITFDIVFFCFLGTLLFLRTNWCPVSKFYRFYGAVHHKHKFCFGLITKWHLRLIVPKDRKVNSFNFEVLCFVPKVGIESRVLLMLSKCSAWLLFVCKLERWESSVTLDPAKFF